MEHDTASSDPLASRRSVLVAGAGLATLFTALGSALQAQSTTSPGHVDGAKDTSVKIIYFMKRKPSLTHAEFRKHMEDVHVMLGQKHFTKYMTSYKRHYPSEVRNARSLGYNQIEWYDCITEFVFPDMEAAVESAKLYAKPEVGGVMQADEHMFIDSDSTIYVTCRPGDVVDTGVARKEG